MRTVSPLVYRHARWGALLPVWVAIALAILALLAFADLWSSGMDLPRLDGPYLAPFRWLPVEIAAAAAAQG
jgi:hypothetical protein